MCVCVCINWNYDLYAAIDAVMLCVSRLCPVYVCYFMYRVYSDMNISRKENCHMCVCVCIPR